MTAFTVLSAMAPVARAREILSHLTVRYRNGTERALSALTCREWYVLCCGGTITDDRGTRAKGCGANRDCSRLSLADRWMSNRYGITNTDTATLNQLRTLLENWNRGGREKWILLYLLSLEIDTLRERVDVVRCTHNIAGRAAMG